MNWKYQSNSNLLDDLKGSLLEHYDNWKAGKTDKQIHSAYFLFSGPGTGKSRTLDEFQRLCIEATKENHELCECLSKAYVFKVYHFGVTNSKNFSGFFWEWNKKNRCYFNLLVKIKVMVYSTRLPECYLMGCWINWLKEKKLIKRIWQFWSLLMESMHPHIQMVWPKQWWSRELIQL